MKHTPIEIPIRSRIVQVACPYCENHREDRLPLTREPLDKFSCPMPDCTCTVVAITPQCHPEAFQLTYYCKEHGTLALFCGDCGELSCVLAIAREIDRKSEAFWAAMYG